VIEAYKTAFNFCNVTYFKAKRCSTRKNTFWEKHFIDWTIKTELPDLLQSIQSIVENYYSPSWNATGSHIWKEFL